ncbi:MAG: hypothetical protein IJW77_15840, partial [Clostridia bacterium]|nr:hypothetical protein [Clostridia bacterium]
SMSGHNESFVLKSVDVRLTGQLAEYMHFALLLIKDLCDLIMRMDIPDHTAPKQTAGGSNPPGDVKTGLLHLDQCVKNSLRLTEGEPPPSAEGAGKKKTLLRLFLTEGVIICSMIFQMQQPRFLLFEAISKIFGLRIDRYRFCMLNEYLLIGDKQFFEFAKLRC